MEITRRDYLTVMGSALLAAGPVSADTHAQERREDGDAEVLQGHGQVWNRALPGVASELKLAFDLRVNLETGTGFGIAQDPLYPEWNLHFRIDSAERTRLRSGDSQFALKGVVTHANGGFAGGKPVRILAQTRGDTTAIAIAIGALAFGGAGLVVIAIIGILIAMLLPAVQK